MARHGACLARIGANPMIRRKRETIGSLLCLAVILAVLVSIDSRVQMSASAILDDPGGTMSPLGDRVSDFGDALLDALRDQSLENAPMMIFAVVGGVLFLFMLKT
jgi:hypothetical protein